MKKSIIGIVLIIISILGILGWEFIGRDSLMYTEILTVNQDVEQGTVITQEMLGLKRISSASSKSYRADDVSSIIGKETKSYLPVGCELYEEYFEEKALVVHADEGEYILSIPESWLVSKPQSLRRGDTVTFLLDGRKITKARVLYVKDGSNSEVTSDNERLTASSTVSIIEVIVNEDEAELLASLAADGNQFVLLYQKEE